MNKIFRVIWNHAIQSFVVVSELAKSKTKVSCSSATVSSNKPYKKVSSFLQLLVFTSIMPSLATAAVVSTVTQNNNPNNPGKGYGDFNIFISANGQNSMGAETNSTTVTSKGAKSLGLEKLRQGDRGANNIVIGNHNDFTKMSGPFTDHNGKKYSGDTENIVVGSRNVISNKAGYNRFMGQMVLLGNDIKVINGAQSVGIGNNVDVIGDSSVAIGGDDLDDASRRHFNGTYDTSGGWNTGSIAGYYKKLTGKGLVSISPITGDQYQRTRTKTASVAVGTQAIAGYLATSIGTKAIAEGVASSALGVGATAFGNASIAMGNAKTENGAVDGIAIGNNAITKEQSGVAIGSYSEAHDKNSLAVGVHSVVGADIPSMVGKEITDKDMEDIIEKSTWDEVTKTTLLNAVDTHTLTAEQANELLYAIKYKQGLSDDVRNTYLSNAAEYIRQQSAMGSASFGNGNLVSGKNTYVLGNNIISKGDNHVILGHNSTERDFSRVEEANVSIDISGKTQVYRYRNFAGADVAVGVVSVGSPMATRQIIHVAPGEIAANSTDAVNGSQLYLVAQRVEQVANFGWKTNAVGKNIVSGTTATEQDIKNNNVVNFEAGTGLTIEQKVVTDSTGNKTVTYVLNATNTAGKDGKDGKDAKANVTTNPNGSHTITIVDGNGTTTSVVVTNGKDGANGKDGKDGTSTTGTVTDNGNGTHTITITNGDGSTTTTVVKNGENGTSTTGTVTDNGNGTHTITITNGDGSTTTSVVTNGKDGKDGKDGTNTTGTVTDNGNGTHTITITNGDGSTTTSVVTDGKDGKDGKDGTSTTGTVTDNGNGTHTITITNGDGSTTTSVVTNGKDGKDGKDATASWNVQENGKDKNTVGNNENVSFNDSSTVNVTVTPNGTTTDVTFDVNTGSSKAEDGKAAPNTTTTYEDKAGNPLTKQEDGSYTNKNGDKVDPKDVVTKVGDENKVATVGDITNTINNTGWTTNNAKVINADGNVVKDADGKDVTKSVVVNPGDQVNYVDGKGSTANITVTTDPATGKDIVNVAYDVNTGNITKAGDQDVKDAAGNVITKAGQVSVANGEGDKVATVQNVADAVNSAGWIVNTGKAEDQSSFTTEAGKAQKVSAGDKVDFQAGKNMEVKQIIGKDGSVKIVYATSDNISLGEKGKDGKDGVDGSIGVNGKDGSAVVINGKDGSIGLNGKDGANGLTIKGEKGSVGVDGTDGKNGKDGMTRIVYTDDKGTKHEVATHDDGLKFTGNDNDTVNNHKLNSVVTVKGEGVDKAASKSFKSASGNINVKADGKGTLEVQLAKDLKGINSISNGKSSVTLNENGGTTIKGGDVNVSGNKITNVKAGTEPTDAVNVSQLRSNITNVNNRINKVSKEARGGIAGANAAAGLPQVYLPGKSMVAASAGTFKGENAFAVGYSRASDNGKLILKLQGNANSQGDVGGSVGVGYQW
ncbi:hypothetical protein BKG93_04925 [Rodentibacter ratti]|uniref:Adhesin n=1 Tax=Rodentibacter ratti TaxID=1906745 RepID=A0A1V3L6D6_9PAST|nr:YadA-like family protein [Rodentibacter ratti]OOF85361.1 hypothetical protein BKG93_04925 [Rodentibacter ratti]